MIDMRYKPRFLPQMNAPYDYVLEKLDEEGVSYKLVEINADDLQPSQGVTFSDEVEKVNLDDVNPIWMSEENKVLDGHHRMVRGLIDNKPLKAIQVGLNEKDAARVLNKIQDIYEYEQKQQMEGLVSQDVINGENEIDSDGSYSEFLTGLEEDNAAVQAETQEKNEKTITAYRKDPINEKSVVGNFFTLEPINGFSAYEIDFENLLDTNELGIAYKDGQEPVDILAKIWFPHINFEKISKQYSMPPENLKAKAIAEQAKRLGYDGIKFGDKLIQGLK